MLSVSLTPTAQQVRTMVRKLWALGARSLNDDAMLVEGFHMKTLSGGLRGV